MRSTVETLRAEVAGRSPVDERERDSIVAFLAAYDRLASPFDEHADPVHVTASAIVVGPAGPDDSGVVLHLHKRLGIWLQPGGHIDAGEHPRQAAWREAREETGLPVGAPRGDEQIVHVDVHPGPRGHTHLDLRYLVRSLCLPPSPGDGESPEARWFAWDEALAVADAGLAGALRALRPRS